jgi:hypothetical protein
LDLLILADNITKRDVEKESFPSYLEDVAMNLKEETTNLEDTTLAVTPQSEMGSNELNDPPMALGLAQYVMNKIW